MTLISVSFFLQHAPGALHVTTMTLLSHYVCKNNSNGQITLALTTPLNPRKRKVAAAYDLVCFSALKIIPRSSAVTGSMPQGLYFYSFL